MCVYFTVDIKPTGSHWKSHTHPLHSARNFRHWNAKMYLPRNWPNDISALEGDSGIHRSRWCAHNQGLHTPAEESWLFSLTESWNARLENLHRKPIFTPNKVEFGARVLPHICAVIYRKLLVSSCQCGKLWEPEILSEVNTVCDVYRVNISVRVLSLC